jgi:hypothetical protein
LRKASTISSSPMTTSPATGTGKRSSIGLSSCARKTDCSSEFSFRSTRSATRSQRLREPALSASSSDSRTSTLAAWVGKEAAEPDFRISRHAAGVEEVRLFHLRWIHSWIPDRHAGDHRSRHQDHPTRAANRSLSHCAFGISGCAVAIGMHVRIARVIWRMARIGGSVKRDPHACHYIDTALTPVTDDEMGAGDVQGDGGSALRNGIGAERWRRACDNSGSSRLVCYRWGHSTLSAAGFTRLRM